MNFEAASIVVKRPQFFKKRQIEAAINFLIGKTWNDEGCKCPSHIHPGGCKEAKKNAWSIRNQKQENKKW